MAYRNAFIVISYGIVTVIIIDILKLEKPSFMIFFQGLFIKAHPQYLKLQKSIFVSFQIIDFFLILLVMILRPISLKKIYL